MGKRKKADGDFMDGDNTVPIPIQNFLWRQSSPYIRPKLGKLRDASCMSFERVLAQNILHGLSPSLCEAIESISRWKLIQAAFPHVMHCGAAALKQRKATSPDEKFTSNETKLLYTLHWIILDAASECEDGEIENGGGRSFHSYLHSLDTIQLFVYLFAPLIDSLKESDFQSLKLENGLRLWQPLWDYRQPDVPCFSTPVKAKRIVLKAQRNLMKVNFNMANIYIGKGTSTDNIYLGPGDDVLLSSPGGSYEAGSPRAPLARLSDICALSTTATETSCEVICDVCGDSFRNTDMTCSCGNRRASFVSAGDRKSLNLGQGVSPIDKEFLSKRLESVAVAGLMQSSANPDVLSGTYLDVAVLRCLFCPQWSEEGIYWALRYMNHRLLEISEERNRKEYHRERSHSLPIPEIRSEPLISSVPPSPQPKQDQTNLFPNPHKDSAEKEHRKEPSFKRRKATLSEKVRSLVRRESAEQIQVDPSVIKDDYSSGTSTPDVLGPESGDGRHSNQDIEESPDDSNESSGSSSEIICQRNVRALRRHKVTAVDEEDEDSSGSGKGHSKHVVHRSKSAKTDGFPKPIITITQESPEQSLASSLFFRDKRESVISSKPEESHRHAPLQRSYTDSNIRYNSNEEMEEVSGSVHYVQNNGQLNYAVVLLAAHGVAGRECSPRINEVLLNLLNCLLDLGIIEKKETAKKTDKPKKADESPASEQKDKENFCLKKEDFGITKKSILKDRTAHSLAMETMIRIYKMIGCPSGCGDGYHGNLGENIRVQASFCLTRLMNVNMPQFRKFIRNDLMNQSLQKIMDFLHALYGFCVEPETPTSPTSQSSKKGGMKEGGHTGYANNFGEARDGGKSIQGQIITQIAKPLVSKFVENKKELSSHDNVGLYCDVRQFINYMKETYGSTFRKVALSCLLEKLIIEPVYAKEVASVTHGMPKASKAIRRNMSITSETGEEKAFREAIAAAVAAHVGSEDGRGSRRSIFRRRVKNKVPILPSHGALSDSEVLEDLPGRPGRLSPRVSMSATEDDPNSGPSTPKRKFSKFNIAWRRAPKSDYDDDSASESPVPETRRESKAFEHALAQHVQAQHSDGATSQGQGQAQGQGQGQGQVQGHTPPAAAKTKKMSFKAASQATLTFLTARKRIEDGLKNWNKRRASKRDPAEDDFGRRGSHEVGNNAPTEKVIVRERKLIQSYAVKSGLLRFNFMLDCTQPGALPDPHLIAALLDLEAPVVGRACLLLECAHFVNRCNRGEWPNWMKLNLPGMRPTGLLSTRGQPSGASRRNSLQRMAGTLFHQWGEALANRMYDIMTDEREDRFTVLQQVKDDDKKKELRSEDDEENFMDEATVNHTGSDCPYALRMVACQLLLEITTFLRETYQYLPRSKGGKREAWDKPASSRRWSSVLSSPGHSERSNSRSSQGDMGGHLTGSPGDRKISFANFGQAERSDSIGSSSTTLFPVEAAEGKGRRVGPTQNKKLLKTRQGSANNSSFRNRSIKIKRPEGGGSIKRVGSVKAPRKVSTQSLQSTVSFDDQSPEIIEHIEQIDESESIGMINEHPQESPDMFDTAEEQDYSKFMPWVKAVVQLANTSNFICDHQNYCHPNCYERQRRSCIRLMTAVRKIYDSDASEQEAQKAKTQSKKGDTLKDKLKRRESMFQPSLSTRRRESTPLLDKIRTDTNFSVKLKNVVNQDKKSEKTKKQKPTDTLPIQKYFRTQVQNLTHSTLSVITKSAPILCEETFVDMMPVAWELLLESDQELAAAAATVFLLASVKVPASIQEMITKQLQHEDVNQRIHAVLRFGVLWRFRYQVWPRMEDGANAYFKVPPPSIDFVLPSPTIGLPSLHVVDPPWQPHFKSKVEEVTINEETSKSFVTATRTRRKEQQEMIHRALLAEEDRRRAARENFHMSTIPIMQQAAHEPALHHVTEDHDEAAISDEIPLTQRRMSVAPTSRPPTSSAPNRGASSGRHGSVFWIGRPTIFEGEEERNEQVHTHHLQMAQHFFPSCICKAALPIIHLLEDLEVNGDGIAVCEVASKVIWMCLVEEPTLFLRTFLEKLTTREKQEELVFLLRKLLFHMPELPAQTAHCLFNYLVGFIMFYVRSPAEGGQEAIGEALSVLHQVVPSVHGIYFKDFKQTLRKEQCDPTLMITANVPSAKKLIVHGPDLSSIPSQLPIHEDTQFSQILQDSLDFFNIDEEEQHSYCLLDTKTNQMHNLNSYVRDFYFFRRNHYPQLSLVHMNFEEASRSLQKQAFCQKFLEMGKVLLTFAIVDSSQGQQQQNHVAFLHEELLKLPSFPRKALETDFGLHSGEMGKEVYGMDTLHKYSWTKLMSKMFRCMSSTITYSGDLPLFLNVINGTLFLHAQDTAMLRMTMATFINAARHFKQVFSTTGFLYMMPTILRVYYNHQSNPIVCNVIEYACKQFFILHRNPFILQMFGSVAPILEMNKRRNLQDCNKVEPEALFRLLLSFEKHSSDKLDILEMVDDPKPLTALDFCYIDDADRFTIIDAVNLCVTVVAYASDSARAMQMLTILQAIIPFYLANIKKETAKKDRLDLVREELNILSNLAVPLRALIASSELMTRNFSGPQRQLESVNASMKSTQNHSNHSPQGPTIYCDEHSDTRFLHMEEGLARGRRHTTLAEDEAELTLKEFRTPRNSLLCVVAEFYAHSTARTKELRRILADPSIRSPELLDHKAHNRLADIANTLLKVAPYDPATMQLPGLQRYMLDILPITDWSQEAVRPALNLVLRRLERLFSKVYKKPVLRRYLDWNAAANLLKGVNSTLIRFAFVAHLPHLKTLINVCLNIILADEGGLTMGDSIHSVQHGRGEATQNKIGAPLVFSSAVIKLTAMQMQALGDLYTLEHICGGISVFPTAEKSVNILVNLVLPLVIRMGNGRRDCPKMRPVDINFALSVILHALMPPNKQVIQSSSCGKSHQLSIGEIGRSASVNSQRKYGPKEMLQHVAFLGLKILIVCCEDHLSTEWFRIVHCVEEIGAKLLGGIPLWRFIDFVVSTRTPLYMMLMPFIQFKMMKAICNMEQEYFLQRLVYRKLQGHDLPAPKSKGSSLVELTAELKHLKEDFCFTTEFRPRSSTVVSDFSGRRVSIVPGNLGISRCSSIHDLIEEQMAARLNPVVPSMPLGGKHVKVPSTSSSTNALRRQVSQHSSEGHAPALVRKSSTRISAREGNLILLENYTHRPLSQDEEGLEAMYQSQQPYIPQSLNRPAHHRKLRRQESIHSKSQLIRQRNVSSQESISTLITESFDEDLDEVSPSPHQHLRRSSTLVTGIAQPKFQRRDGIVRRQRFAKQQALSFDSSFVAYCDDSYSFSSPVSSREQLVPLETVISQEEDGDCDHHGGDHGDGGDHRPNGDHQSEAGRRLSTRQPRRPPLSPAQEENGLETPRENPTDSLTSTYTDTTDESKAPHRLQRQDAKSRKTFKIKRNQSTIKKSMMRSSTVKATTTRSATRREVVTSSSAHGLGSPVSLTKMTFPGELGDGIGGISRSVGGMLERVTVMSGDGREARGLLSDGGATGSGEVAPPVHRPVTGPQTSHPLHERHGSTERRMRSSRPLFVPKSKSHDEGSDTYVSAGTARGRIAARHGARHPRSRSPSGSPSRADLIRTGSPSDADLGRSESPFDADLGRSGSPSDANLVQSGSPSGATNVGQSVIHGDSRGGSDVQEMFDPGRRQYGSMSEDTLRNVPVGFVSGMGLSAQQSQAYVSKTDSFDSLSAEENAALLREEEKSQSDNSLLIFYDGSDGQEHTCV